jgi:hypothetical protein
VPSHPRCVGEKKCHPDRSVAKWRDPRILPAQPQSHEAKPLPRSCRLCPQTGPGVSVLFEDVLPTGAQRSGGIRFSTGTIGFDREADFSTPPLTVKL